MLLFGIIARITRDKKKPEDVEIFGFFDGGAYEARIYTLLSKHVEMKGGEHAISFHPTT